MKGFINRKLTPKIAGSVIPNEADNADGIATVLILGFLVLTATAKHAPNCAKFAADAIGIQMFKLPNSLDDNKPASITLYI